MANIPSINRTISGYSRLRRSNTARSTKTEESVEDADTEETLERRRIKDRRRKNVSVLFNRRKRSNRRRIKLNGTTHSDHETHPQKGSNINTTA